MTTGRTARFAALTTLAVASLACLACTGNLDSPTLVVTPRILAITADHPESAPGTDVRLRVMAHDPEGRALSYRWSACIEASTVLGGAVGGGNSLDGGTGDAGFSFDAGAGDAGPGGNGAFCVPFESTTFEAVVPGVVTRGIVDALDRIATVTGFDVEAIREILRTAGLAFEVHVDVLAPDGTVLVSGYKRIAITTRATVTTNPPPIDYLVADVPVRSANDPLGAPFECLVARPIRIPAGERVVLAPQGDETPWIETFPIYGYTGTVGEGRENAYYSWYSTTTLPRGATSGSAGGVSAETTRPPDRDVFYRAPSEPGTVRIFLIVRDGHLGTRACHFDIEVLPAVDAGASDGSTLDGGS